MKKRIGTLLVILVFAFVTGGIFASGRQEGMSGQEESTAAKQEILYQCIADKQDAVKLVAGEFNKKHPDVRVVVEPLAWTGAFEKVIAEFMGGTAPDVVDIHSSWIHQFAAQGFLMDISSQFAAIDKGDFWRDAVSHFQYKGRQYAVPTFIDTFAYLYHVSSYLEAGLDPEKPPQDWAELVDHLKKLTDREKGIYGFGLVAKAGVHEGASMVNMFIRQNKGSILNEDYTKCLLNQPAAVEGVQFVADLYLKHKVCPPGILEYAFKEMDPLFASGTVATVYQSMARHANLVKLNPELNYRVTPIPEGKQARGARMYGWAAGIPEGAKRKNNAWKYLEFMHSPEMARVMIATGLVSTGPRISVAESDPTLMKQPFKGFIDAAKVGGYLDPPIPQWREISLVEMDALQTVYLEKQTAQQAMDKLVQQVDAILKSE